MRVGLYRHAKSGRYYGAKKINGRRKERSLGTADRKIAERRLAEWIVGLSSVDSEVEKTTLRQLNRKFIAVNQGKAQSTRDATQAILKDFESWWPHGLDFQVRNVRPSHLDEWLATHERRLKNTSYNRYAGVLKGVFDLAVKDRIITASPFLQVSTRWKKPQQPLRLIPTVEQFEAIVANIRSQRFTDHAEDSADFVEFLGLAGLGQAEAASLKWGEVDFERETLSIRRHKTDTRFTVRTPNPHSARTSRHPKPTVPTPRTPFGHPKGASSVESALPGDRNTFSLRRKPPSVARNIRPHAARTSRLPETAFPTPPALFRRPKCACSVESAHPAARNILSPRRKHPSVARNILSPRRNRISVARNPFSPWRNPISAARNAITPRSNGVMEHVERLITSTLRKTDQNHHPPVEHPPVEHTIHSSGGILPSSVAQPLPWLQCGKKPPIPLSHSQPRPHRLQPAP